MKQTIRIIGGLHKGKKLHFPEVPGLRPTPERVRETIFNWLMHDIRSMRCLDAFAGSGALGLEALSRGALEVVLIEKNHDAYVNLQKVASTINETQLCVIKQDAYQFIQQTEKSFDLIFLDPPFNSNMLEQCLDYIYNSDILTKNGLIYIESSTKPLLNPLRWNEIKLKRAGQVTYGLFKKQS